MSGSQHNRRVIRERQGAAALEMALVLPLFITIVLGCIDYGRFCYMHIALTNAVRAGAGVASFRPFTVNTKATWEAAVRTAVTDELSAQASYIRADLDEQLTVDAPVVTTDSNNLRRVRVVGSYVFTPLVSWPLLPDKITLRTAVEMRIVR